MYHIYIEEVLEGLNTETFGSQVLIFEKFLKEKNYNHSVFVQKLRKISRAWSWSQIHGCPKSVGKS